MSATGSDQLQVAFVAKKGRTIVASSSVLVTDGAVSAFVASADLDADAVEQADVAFTVKPDQIDALREAATSLSVWFMRGELKMSGDFGKLFDVLPVLDGADFAAARGELLSGA